MKGKLRCPQTPVNQARITYKGPKGGRSDVNQALTYAGSSRYYIRKQLVVAVLGSKTKTKTKKKG